MLSTQRGYTNINTLKLFAIAIMLATLASCAAISTGLSKKDLNVQTKMSNSIFLPPVAPSQKVVYIEMHNTSGGQFALLPTIKKAVENQGYRITNNPNHAHFFLQANIRQIGKTDKSASEAAFGSSYGGALSGVALGAGVGAVTGGSTGGMVAGGIIGGIASTIADSMVKDVRYSVIVDIQVTAKLAKGQTAKTHTVAHTQQGSSTQTVTQYSGKTHAMQYRTRIVSVAEKANLTLAAAKPVLVKQLGSAIASIF